MPTGMNDGSSDSMWDVRTQWITGVSTNINMGSMLFTVIGQLAHKRLNIILKGYKINCYEYLLPLGYLIHVLYSDVYIDDI